MGVLAEYLKTERDQLQAEGKNQAEAIAEWQGALSRLYEQLTEWLQAADGGLGVLSVKQLHQHDIQEPRLGGYSAPILTFNLGGRRGHVWPRARYVAATIHPAGREPRRADGMVELRYDTTAEYYLFRWKGESGDEWFIQSVTGWKQAKEYGTVEPLDRDRFEAAVLRILQ